MMNLGLFLKIANTPAPPPPPVGWARPMQNKGSTPSEGREQVRSARGGGETILEKKKKRLLLQHMKGVWIGGGNCCK